MSIISKEFDDKKIEYRLPGHVEALRLRGALQRRVKKYSEEIENDEFMAEMIEVMEPLFKVEGFDSYLSMFDDEIGREQGYEALIDIHGHIYMSDKKKESLKSTPPQEQVD